MGLTFERERERERERGRESSTHSLSAPLKEICDFVNFSSLAKEMVAWQKTAEGSMIESVPNPLTMIV